MPVVTATAHFCCWVERKKGINLIKLCLIFRLWTPPVFGFNTSRVARRERKELGPSHLFQTQALDHLDFIQCCDNNYCYWNKQISCLARCEWPCRKPERGARLMQTSCRGLNEKAMWDLLSVSWFQVLGTKSTFPQPPPLFLGPEVADPGCSAGQFLVLQYLVSSFLLLFVIFVLWFSCLWSL